MSIGINWVVRGHEAVGLTDDPEVFNPGGGTAFIPHSPDPLLEGSSLPWALPEYPTHLIYGVGLTIVTSAVAGTRRLRLQLTQPNGAFTEWLSSGTQLAGLSRRWECAVGYALDTTVTGASVYREPLPRGFMLLPGLVGTSEGQLLITINGFQAGDVLGPITLRTHLLLP